MNHEPFARQQKSGIGLRFSELKELFGPIQSRLWAAAEEVAQKEPVENREVADCPRSTGFRHQPERPTERLRHIRMRPPLARRLSMTSILGTAPADKPPAQRTIVQLFSAVARIDGLGRATVLPQLKEKRLCAAVGATAVFDPKATSDLSTS